MLDNSNNEVRQLQAPEGREVWELVETPGRGYVGVVGEFLPGPIDSWYGPGERYPDAATALAATQEV